MHNEEWNSPQQRRLDREDAIRPDSLYHTLTRLDVSADVLDLSRPLPDRFVDESPAEAEQGPNRKKRSWDAASLVVRGMLKQARQSAVGQDAAAAISADDSAVPSEETSQSIMRRSQMRWEFLDNSTFIHMTPQRQQVAGSSNAAAAAVASALPATSSVTMERYHKQRQHLDERHIPDLYSMQRQSAKRRKACTAAQRKALAMWDIPRDKQKYDLFLGLHQLWCQYIENLLEGTAEKSNAMLDMLIRADLHGCILRVVRSKCPAYVGLSGIIVQETEQTFRMISKQNSMKVIPKAGSVFEFSLGNRQFTLYGDHFCFRSFDRSARKYSTKTTIDIA